MKYETIEELVGHKRTLCADNEFPADPPPTEPPIVCRFGSFYTSNLPFAANLVNAANPPTAPETEQEQYYDAPLAPAAPARRQSVSEEQFYDADSSSFASRSRRPSFISLANSVQFRRGARVGASRRRTL